MSNKVRAIAFYLPQFYPTPENDEWWEPGFTEWTNVARAQPLFKGHYQPRIPRDLSFYDLRVPEVREKQALLAREAGIEGFCYWHYWFGNGKRLLSEVFKEVVETGKPDFPFCLCWANHSWYAKTWDPNMPDKLLMEQTYPGEEDFIAHFNEMLPAFKDKRYIRVNGKLLFGIFKPWTMDLAKFSNVWDRLAKDNGLNGFHFFALAQGIEQYERCDLSLLDSIALDTLSTVYNPDLMSRAEQKRIRKHLAAERPYYVTYDTYMKKTIQCFKDYPLAYPCLNPDFDHTPRSGYKAKILHGSTPEKWAELLRQTKDMFSYRPTEENILFIKAWNEWGEGNYLEPDSRYKKGYIEEMGKVLK
jgi:hypothetical protein